MGCRKKYPLLDVWVK